jgi:hypothetical protein
VVKKEIKEEEKKEVDGEAEEDRKKVNTIRN